MQVRTNHRLISAVCVLLFSVAAFPLKSQSIEDPLLSEWKEFCEKPQCNKLLQWLRCQARARLTGSRCNDRFDKAIPGYFGRLGIFVTLKKGNRVRGCFGAFSHSTTDAGDLLSDYLAGALTRDPRYKPLDVTELAETRIIITITSQPFPVHDIDSIDLRNFGVTLVCGNETTVFVPAEIRSTSYIEKKIRESTCQISSFRAVTLQ